MPSSRPPLARRSLIQAFVGGAMLAGAAAARGAEPAPPKLTQAQAKYQDHPEDIRMCATCSLFEAPKACKVVEGEVSKTGWCELFALLD